MLWTKQPSAASRWSGATSGGEMTTIKIERNSGNPMKCRVIQKQPIKYRVFRVLTEARQVDALWILEEASRGVFVLEAPGPGLHSLLFSSYSCINKSNIMSTVPPCQQFAVHQAMGIMLDVVEKRLCRHILGLNCLENSMFLCLNQVQSNIKSSYQSQRVLNPNSSSNYFLLFIRIFSSLSTVQGLYPWFLLHRVIYI